MSQVVVVADRAQKQLRRVPRRIADKLVAWAQLAEEQGLLMVRRLPSFHDEPLKGDRKGERSIRLSLHYRAIYTVAEGGAVEVVTVEEVTKHDY